LEPYIINKLFVNDLEIFDHPIKMRKNDMKYHLIMEETRNSFILS